MGHQVFRKLIYYSFYVFIPTDNTSVIRHLMSPKRPTDTFEYCHRQAIFLVPGIPKWDEPLARSGRKIL